MDDPIEPPPTPHQPPPPAPEVPLSDIRPGAPVPEDEETEKWSGVWLPVLLALVGGVSLALYSRFSRRARLRLVPPSDDSSDG